MDDYSHGHALLTLPHALLLLLLAPGRAEAFPSLTDPALATCLAPIRSSISSALRSIFSSNSAHSLRPVTLVGMVKVAAFCGFLPALWLWHRQKRPASSGSLSDVSDSIGADAASTDPGLLKKHSTIRSYTVPTTNFTYPAIRTFYRPHSQGDKLPQTPRPVPLLVFIHGLGGSVAQFHPLLVSFINLAPCLSIDLPGCGVSQFTPATWEAYTTDALVRLLAVVIESYRDKGHDQGVVLIGHSMGCSLAALLASSSSPYADAISRHVVGLVAVCPKATPPTQDQAKRLKLLLAIPNPIFDAMRWWDRRGGTESKSVARFVGPGAEEEAKKLQLRFNMQSKTPVWRRMARGMLPDYSSGAAQGGLPGKETWSGLQIPVFLAAGEADLVTPASELKDIASFLGKDVSDSGRSPASKAQVVPDSAAPIDSAAKPPPRRETKQDSGVDSSDLPDLTTSSTLSSTGECDTGFDSSSTISPISRTHIPEPLPRKLVLKTTVLPHPASHALLYAPTTSRTLAGLIGTFLSTHVDARLSLGWQLQYLTTEGKWDVKNLAKWQAVKPVSEPIGGVFRAMKTLREVDEQHCPKVFVDEWKTKIAVVVDISHESPVYDPAGLEAGGIMYRKFPTVSKLPPTVDEVNAFIALIDQLRSEPGAAGAESAAADAQATSSSAPLSTAAVSGTSQATPTTLPTEAKAISLSASPPGDSVFASGKQGLIGVHCHYGFNRTGFFLVCYLVERLGYSLPAALREFETARPPGIRHEHFKDALYVRYCMGLKRAPTL
ncbi:alpha/beta-hydrolase [Mytilinidion resinicola]|uniref:Alpha/beta-hydrolase n=1 Tax=Mytilinidion resinicola TaxID=574789 RepID=A0A6A6Z7A4_9PEZI|nr:alpha/beta-hydrolase [Mytilinidion resinicola]KAF2816698.1 alpha/beta-hydrolase [Mytilinidion resinicola]